MASKKIQIINQELKHQLFKTFLIEKKESLRDNMTNIELALNTLAEASATEISRQQNPETLGQHIKVAQSGGNVARKYQLQNQEMIKPNEHDKSSFGCEDEESCVTSQQTSDSFFVR